MIGKNHLRDQIVTAVPAEWLGREVLEKIVAERKERGTEEHDVVRFELQKYLKRSGQEGKFYQVWTKMPAMILEVTAYNMWLEASVGSGVQEKEIWKAFRYWGEFVCGPMNIEADFLDNAKREQLLTEGWTKLNDGRTVKLRCAITGEVYAIERGAAELNPGFCYRDSDLVMTAGSTIWMAYDLAAGRGVITEARSLVPTQEILALNEEVLQPEKTQLTKEWLSGLLSQDTERLRARKVLAKQSSNAWRKHLGWREDT